MTAAISVQDVDGQRIAMAGKAVKLGSKAALSLSLNLHELAANASKYGPLSVES